MSLGVEAVLALSWKRAFSEQGVNAVEENSVGGLSLFKAGPFAAFTVGAMPNNRNAVKGFKKAN
jgi:hypothetical protein